MMNLVEQGRPVLGLAPVATNGNPTTAYVGLANYQMLYAIVSVTKGNAALTSFTLSQANTAAGGAAAAFVNTVPIWSNLNTTTNDVLVRRANALTYALDNAADGRGQVVVFQIDPDRLSDGFTHVALVVANGDAANLASVNFIGVQSRYAQETPPSMRV